MQSFPRDVLREIFAYLSFKDLYINITQVNKTWYAVVTNIKNLYIERDDQQKFVSLRNDAFELLIHDKIIRQEFIDYLREFIVNVICRTVCNKNFYLIKVLKITMNHTIDELPPPFDKSHITYVLNRASYKCDDFVCLDNAVIDRKIIYTYLYLINKFSTNYIISYVDDYAGYFMRLPDDFDFEL